MRIRSNVVPTPIVSAVGSQPAKGEAQSTPLVEAAPAVPAEPMEIDLLNAKVQLQPGELAKIVDKVNETAQIFNQALRFQVAESHRIVVQVIDLNRGEVIREIPPERFIDLFDRMEDAVGLLLDMRA